MPVLPARLGILVSGVGSTYANLVQAIGAGSLAAEIAVVVASKPDAPAIDKARGFGHRVVVASESAAVTAALREAEAQWVAMCGWMRYWDPPAEFHERVVNVHPSLLPAFGGKGMYGRRVHEAVLAHGCKLTGCTVHLVSGDYDSGPILAQEAVPVLATDSVDTLQQRVQAAERRNLPLVLHQLITGGLRRNATGWWPAT